MSVCITYQIVKFMRTTSCYRHLNKLYKLSWIDTAQSNIFYMKKRTHFSSDLFCMFFYCFLFILFSVFFLNSTEHNTISICPFPLTVKICIRPRFYHWIEAFILTSIPFRVLDYDSELINPFDKILVLNLLFDQSDVSRFEFLSIKICIILRLQWQLKRNKLLV